MEKQMLSEILDNLKMLNITVAELKDGQSNLYKSQAVLLSNQSKLMANQKKLEEMQIKLEERQTKFEERQIKFEENQKIFGEALLRLEKITIDLRDDVDTLYDLTKYNFDFLRSHFNDFNFKIG